MGKDIKQGEELRGLGYNTLSAVNYNSRHNFAKIIHKQSIMCCGNKRTLSMSLRIYFRGKKVTTAHAEMEPQ